MLKVEQLEFNKRLTCLEHGKVVTKQNFIILLLCCNLLLSLLNNTEASIFITLLNNLLGG